MSVIKKSDVKNHLATHDRKGIRLFRPASQPDATGFSGEETQVVRETAEKPLSNGQNTPSTAIEAGLKPVLVPPSKSAQA